MVMSGSTYVVVGAGQAGGRAVEAMRGAGFEGRVVLIGEESHPPYERPPLSKKLLMGEVEAVTTYLNRPEFYTENDIEFIAGVRAESLERFAGRALIPAEPLDDEIGVVVLNGQPSDRKDIPKRGAGYAIA